MYLENKCSNLILNSLYFESNLVKNSAGGMLVGNSDNILMGNITFLNNTAGVSGGSLVLEKNLNANFSGIFI